MSFELKNLQITNWYKAIIAISAPILFLAIGSNKPAIAMISTGTLVFGIAEWINHPKSVEFRGPLKITDYPRRATLLGVLLDAIGILLIGYGTYRAGIL